MNKKLIGFALVFSLVGGFLAACDQGTTPTDGTSPSPAESPSPTTSPSP